MATKDSFERVSWVRVDEYGREKSPVLKLHWMPKDGTNTLCGKSVPFYASCLQAVVFGDRDYSPNVKPNCKVCNKARKNLLKKGRK